MGRIMRFIALILIALPTISLALDKQGAAPPQKSLAEEAAYLGEKSGSHSRGEGGWKSAEVTVTSATGEKQMAKLVIWFVPEKDQPAGDLWLGCEFAGRGGAAGVAGFELEEKDGRRYLNLTHGARDPKFNPNPKVFATLEYKIQAETLTLKGGEVPHWAGSKADFTQAIALEPAKK